MTGRKMRIAMIGQKGIPATYGGIERQVEEVATRLVARGHEVAVYCRLYYTHAKGTYRGVRLIRRPSLNTKHLDTATHCVVSTLDVVARHFDLVHFHALGPSAFSFFPRIFGARTAVTVHGLDWEREKWGPLAAYILQRCEYSALHFPSTTIVVSKTLRRYFEDKYTLSPTVIPNGTSIPVHREPQKIRKWGLGARDYILFVGRLVPEKGCHFLLDAYERIRPDVKLVLAGGSSHSDVYVQRLLERKSDRVLFLDYVHGEALEELWSNALFVVQPSTMEGLSISLLEAMSYGKCVLVSDIPENLEVVEDAAASFRTRDVDDLEAKLRILLQDRANVAAYEALCASKVSQRYSWDRIVDQIEEVYRRTLAGEV